MRNDYIFIKCSIGDDVFTLGDGRLLSASVRLGEGRKQSGCEFTIFDPQGAIAQKYLAASYSQGGIDVPSEFFDNPEEEKKTTSTENVNDSITSDSSGGTVSTGGVFTPTIRAFLDLIAYKEVPSNVVLTLQGYYANNGIKGSQGFFDDADIESGNGFPKTAGTKFNVGRYQFNRGDWEHAKKSNNQIKGFSPKDQDLIAYFKLGYRKVLEPLAQNNLSLAIKNAGKEWASLPGSPYGQVQAGYTEQQAIAYFKQRLDFYNNKSAVQDTTLSTDKQQSQPKGKATNSDTGEYKTVRVLARGAKASFYGLRDGFDGRKTASQEIFRAESDMTCAHETLPFGTLLKVTWKANDKSVIVRVNDRGKFKSYYGREIDLSLRAARELGDSNNNPITTGVLTVDIDVVQKVGTTTTPTEGKEAAKSSASQSIQQAKENTSKSGGNELSAKGTPITIEMSRLNGTSCVYSFIHVGTSFDAPITNNLTFKGSSIAWMMNRVLKNTRLENITLKALATQICKGYGFTLDMSEEGGIISSVSQSSQSDLAFLNYVCERMGYYLRFAGKQVSIKKYSNLLSQVPSFALTVGTTLLNFAITDTAQTSAVGSDEKIKIEQGIQKTIVDADSGSMVVVGKEKLDVDSKTIATGKNVPEKKLETSKTSATQTISSDNITAYDRPADKPVKEFSGTASMYTNQEALELLTPATAFFLKGSIEFVDRPWFIESVDHMFSDGILKSDISFYTPVGAKKASESSTTSTSSSTSSTTTPALNDNGVGKIAPYRITNPRGGNVKRFEDLTPHWRGSSNYARYISRAGQAEGKISHLKGRPTQLVYDFTIWQNGSNKVPVPSPVSGQVVRVGGGYGITEIKFDNGASVRLLHMSAIRVAIGDKVTRGQFLGTQDRVDAGGASTGVHIHIESPENVLREYISSLVTGNFGSPAIAQPKADIGKSNSSEVAKKYGHFAYKSASPSNLTTVNGQQVDTDLATAFNSMAAAANAQGIKLKIVSGFRSVSSQKNIFESTMNKRNQTPQQRARVSAPPGYSQHHTGFAIDINSTEPTFAKTPAFKWLQTNASTYGFEMPFTKNNSQGVDFEPWHWVYSGSTRAKSMLEPLSISEFKTEYAGNTSVYQPD